MVLETTIVSLILRRHVLISYKLYPLIYIQQLRKISIVFINLCLLLRSYPAQPLDCVQNLNLKNVVQE